ncbi:MAG TPA: DUF2179 domain-containing protein [Anaerolineales bacterium]|nr:DUF2179 domain-containing protein [Anaerolineales bacterium]
METFDWYSWVTLPLIVFLARLADVTLGTMRIIFISRGKKYLAPLFGFVEVFIWITVVSQIVRGAQNIVAYLAYAAGFAIGNYVGMLVEERLAIGTLVIRVILPKEGASLVNCLRVEGYGVTYVDGHGANGPVTLIYTVVMRKDLSRVISLIQECQPKAFFTVEELRSAQQGIFPARAPSSLDRFTRKKSRWHNPW